MIDGWCVSEDGLRLGRWMRVRMMGRCPIWLGCSVGRRMAGLIMGNEC